MEALAGKGTLGVEEKNLHVGWSLALGVDRLKNASNLFRTWREVRSGQDLGAQILGSLGTKYAPMHIQVILFFEKASKILNLGFSPTFQKKEVQRKGGIKHGRQVNLFRV